MLGWLRGLLTALGVGWLLGGPTAGAPAPTAAPSAAPIKIAAGPGTPLPSSYLGFSVEYQELPMYERFTPAFERILRLWTVSGDGRVVLRIGGASADRTYWRPGSLRLPARAYVLTRGWFRATARLIAQADLDVILDLNLKHGTAQLAAQMAREAIDALPPSRILAFEIGNEPDRYANGYSPTAYAEAVRAYATALAPVAPLTPLLGPEISNTASGIGWLRSTASWDGAELGGLDGHRYQLGGCVGRHSTRYPTVRAMLSPRMTVGLVGAVEPAIVLAHNDGKPFRLDELGSIDCGGVNGVSNSFATALWAPDALFSLWAAKLDAVNLHIRAAAINGPLQVGPTGFIARPLAYGLALFARAASPDGVLLPIRLTSPSGLSGWAVQVATGAIHVVLINKGSVANTVRLAFPGASSVSVQRLEAPSAAATSGVTLAGQQLAPDGQLVGAPVNQPVASDKGAYTIDVPAASAALVTAQPAG